MDAKLKAEINEWINRVTEGVTSEYELALCGCGDAECPWTAREVADNIEVAE